MFGRVLSKLSKRIKLNFSLHLFIRDQALESFEEKDLPKVGIPDASYSVSAIGLWKMNRSIALLSLIRAEAFSS